MGRIHILATRPLTDGRIMAFRHKMNASAAPIARDPAVSRLGVAWVLLCLALAAHVTDEALTGFLAVYNLTVLALRARLGFWSMPTFTFREWLTGLVAGVLVLIALSQFVFRGSPWIRPLFYFFAILMIANGLGHTLGTIFGRTVSSVRFARPMPGFYSSPLLLAASGYALVQLRRTRQPRTVAPPYR